MAVAQGWVGNNKQLLFLNTVLKHRLQSGFERGEDFQCLKKKLFKSDPFKINVFPTYTYVVCMGACPNHGPKSDFIWASASTLRCIIYGQRPQTELLKCHFSFHLMVAAQSDLCDNTEWSKCHSQNYTGKRSICILYQINLENLSCTHARLQIHLQCLHTYWNTAERII